MLVLKQKQEAEPSSETGTSISFPSASFAGSTLIEGAGFKRGEKVLVVDNANGSRLETYLIEEKANSGSVVIYGAAAHLIKRGNEIIIMGFELSDKQIKPRSILVDEKNKFIKYLK